mgnify:CR=1 FL=1
MHLFFIDQFISLDMMAPIMYRLSKKKKIYLYSFNKIQSYKDTKIYKFINNQKKIFIIENLTNIFSLKFILLIIIKILANFPFEKLNKSVKFWKYIWLNYNFVSKKKLIQFIKKNKILSISIDESLEEKKRYFLIEICKELNLPLIMNHGGLYTIKAIKNDFKKFEETSFFLSPNKFPIYTYKLNQKYLKSGKYLQYGSPRFDEAWLNIIKKLNDKKKVDNKIKVAFFVRPTSVSYTDTLQILKNLSKINNLEVRLNYKPRDVLPTKYSKFNKNDMQSSELIAWSDLVLCYASSIILEAVCLNKPLIYLNYLKIDKETDISWFDNLKFVKKAKNLNQSIELIKNFTKKSNKYVVNGNNKKIILKKFISNSKAKGILEKYYTFYNKISI